MVEDFLHPDELNPCLDGIAEEVDTLANVLLKAGKITGIHKKSHFILNVKL